MLNIKTKFYLIFLGLAAMQNINCGEEKLTGAALGAGAGAGAGGGGSGAVNGYSWPLTGIGYRTAGAYPTGAYPTGAYPAVFPVGPHYFPAGPYAHLAAWHMIPPALGGGSGAGAGGGGGGSGAFNAYGLPPTGIGRYPMIGAYPAVFPAGPYAHHATSPHALPAAPVPTPAGASAGVGGGGAGAGGGGSSFQPQIIGRGIKREREPLVASAGASGDGSSAGAAYVASEPRSSKNPLNEIPNKTLEACGFKRVTGVLWKRGGIKIACNACTRLIGSVPKDLFGHITKYHPESLEKTAKIMPKAYDHCLNQKKNEAKAARNKRAKNKASQPEVDLSV